MMSQGVVSPPSQELSEEDIHDVLRNKRRRLVIDILQETENPVSVRELSERIGAVEAGSDPPPRSVKQSVYVSLLQTHLPKLGEMEIVDYDSDRKLVSVDGGLDDVTVYMETVPKYGLSWSEYFAALSILGLLTIVAAESGVPVVTALTGLEWAYGFFLLILASAVYQTYRQGRSIFHRMRSS